MITTAAPGKMWTADLQAKYGQSQGYGSDRINICILTHCTIPKPHLTLAHGSGDRPASTIISTSHLINNVQLNYRF